MSDERERPEQQSAPQEPPSSVELSEDLRKGYVVMPVESGPNMSIVDDMSDMPPAGQVSMEPAPTEQPPPEVSAPPPSDDTE